MREIRQSGSEGGEAKAFPTPIKKECFATFDEFVMNDRRLMVLAGPS